ncbi:FAD:protein FMN transferase [Clostridia bacterium]|nr:FAD:protein FMN transferase [Clostridia bacterium]
MKRILLLSSMILLIASVFFWQQNMSKEVSVDSFLMDTLVSIKVMSTDEEAAEEAINDALSAMQQLDNQVDRYEDNPDNVIFKINQASGKEYISLPDDVLSLIQTAQSLSEASGGAFDISIGVLVDLWKKSESEGLLAPQEEFASALSLVDYSAILIEDNMVKLAKSGMSLDLGALAKGASADLARDILIEHGISQGIIDAGGNIVVIGSKDDETPWKIGITDPNQPGDTMGYVEVRDTAIVTAGIYQRFYTINDQQYHHILSPFTGYPAEGLKSVTVLCDSSTLADAISTTIVVLGPEKGLAFIESFPEAEAILITDNDQLLFSSGARSYFTLLKEDSFYE